MKKIIVTVFTIALLVISCGKGNSIEDKKAQLEKLKKESTTLAESIKKLEEEIAKVTGVKPQNNTVKNVAVEGIVLQSFKHYIDVQGKIDGDEDVNVSAKTPGTVSRILVKEGDEVVKGQVLAEMESYVLQQGLEEIKTSLAFATEIYEKQKNLWNQKIGTEVQYLSAKNTKESLEKKRATLKEQIELSKIKSPINGVVDAVDVKMGQALAPGLPAFRIVNLNQLKVVAEVSETYASNVKKGNNVLVVFPDLDKQIEASISYTSKVINNITRTFTAEAHLEAKNPEYRPNMIAILKIVDYQKEGAIVVPVNLIQQLNGEDFVFVAATKNGKEVVAKKQVKVGQIYNGKAEVLSGLTIGDKLITAGHLDVTEGNPIKY